MKDSLIIDPNRSADLQRVYLEIAVLALTLLFVCFFSYLLRHREGSSGARLQAPPCRQPWLAVELFGALGEGGGATVPAEGGLLQDTKVKNCMLQTVQIYWLQNIRLFQGNNSKPWSFLLFLYWRSNSPAAFLENLGSLQKPIFQAAAIHHKTPPPAPEIRTYDPVTGKLIRRGPQVSRPAPFIQTSGGSLLLSGQREPSGLR